MPLWHDRRPERPAQSGEDRKARRDVVKTVRKDDAKLEEDKKKER
jgi:hypothetical protein